MIAFAVAAFPSCWGLCVGRGPIGIICCYCPYCVYSWGHFSDLPVLQFVTIAGRFNFHTNLVGGHREGKKPKSLQSICGCKDPAV